MASVIPLVIDSGKVLCLDVGPETEDQIRTALAELKGVDSIRSHTASRFWPRCEGELSGSIHIQVDRVGSSASDPFSASNSGQNGGGGGRGHSPHRVDLDKVVAKVEHVLKGRIKGLTELVVQVEAADSSFCACMTGSG